jgi:hypothetical protein
MYVVPKDAGPVEHDWHSLSTPHRPPPQPQPPVHIHTTTTRPQHPVPGPAHPGPPAPRLPSPLSMRSPQPRRTMPAEARTRASNTVSPAPSSNLRSRVLRLPRTLVTTRWGCCLHTRHRSPPPPGGWRKRRTGGGAHKKRRLRLGGARRGATHTHATPPFNQRVPSDGAGAHNAASGQGPEGAASLVTGVHQEDVLGGLSLV